MWTNFLYHFLAIRLHHEFIYQLICHFQTAFVELCWLQTTADSKRTTEILPNITCSYWTPHKTMRGYPAKGPYLPCVSIAGKALLAGYLRIRNVVNRYIQYRYHLTTLKTNKPENERAIGDWAFAKICWPKYQAETSMPSQHGHLHTLHCSSFWCWYQLSYSHFRFKFMTWWRYHWCNYHLCHQEWSHSHETLACNI